MERRAEPLKPRLTTCEPICENMTEVNTGLPHSETNW